MQSALRIVNTSVDGLELDLSYIDGVRRIFGNQSAIGEFDSTALALNGSYKVPVENLDVKLTAYAYLLDLGDVDDFGGPDDGIADEFGVANSSSTYGGEVLVKKGPFGIKGRYATQSDTGDNPVNFTADYFNVEGWAGYKEFTVRGGIEVLGSDDGEEAFGTPLATLHKFNGWADTFLNTPDEGLQDLYINAGYKIGDIGPIKGVGFNVIYHDFESDIGGLDFGEEVDGVIKGKLGEVGLLLKWANYTDASETETRFADEQIFWAQTSYKF